MNFKISQELGVRVADFQGRISLTSEKLMDLHSDSQFSYNLTGLLIFLRQKC